MITVTALNSVKEKHGITNEALDQMNTEVNEKFNLSENFQVFVSITEDGEYHAQTYLHPKSDFFKAGDSISIAATATKSFISAVVKAVEKALTLDRCEHKNHFLAASDEGAMLTNGVAYCADCQSMSRPNFLPPIEGNKTISISRLGMGSGRYYVTVNDWGSAGVQGGDRGIVIGSKATKRTAFFEGFPTIDGVGTFIRGEGTTLAEAEAAAWEKFKQQSECGDHDWSRKVRETERTDGYAICTKCSLRGKALEPLTKCHICDTPTTTEFKDQYICTDHHNELTFEQLLEEQTAYNQSRLDDSTSLFCRLETQKEVDEENFREVVSLTFKVAYRDERLKRGLAFPDTEHDMIDYMFFCSFKENVFGKPSYEHFSEIPDVNDPSMVHNLQHIKNNMSAFVDTIEAGKVDFSPLIIGMMRVPVKKTEKKTDEQEQ